MPDDKEATEIRCPASAARLASGRTVAELFADLEKTTDAADELRKDGDRWRAIAAEIAEAWDPPSCGECVADSECGGCRRCPSEILRWAARRVDGKADADRAEDLEFRHGGRFALRRLKGRCRSRCPHWASDDGEEGNCWFRNPGEKWDHRTRHEDPCRVLVGWIPDRKRVDVRDDGERKILLDGDGAAVGWADDDCDAEPLEERVLALLASIADEAHPLAWPRPWLLDRFGPRLLAVLRGEADPGYPATTPKRPRSPGPPDG